MFLSMIVDLCVQTYLEYNRSVQNVSKNSDRNKYCINLVPRAPFQLCFEVFCTAVLHGIFSIVFVEFVYTCLEHSKTTTLKQLNCIHLQWHNQQLTKSPFLGSISSLIDWRSCSYVRPDPLFSIHHSFQACICNKGH